MPSRPALLLALLALGGCGTGARDAVRWKTEQFARAAGSHDYRTICTQILAPSLLSRLTANHISCEQVRQVGLAHVHRPTLSTGKVASHDARFRRSS